MKKLHSALFTLAILISFIPVAKSQINNYQFTSTVGAYQEIAAGTVHGTAVNDDQAFSGIPIGFSFVFNGQSFTTASICANGYIAFGSSLFAADFPISAGITNNIISAFGADIKGLAQTGVSSELRSETSGVAPNRVFTVQWKNYVTGGITENYNFQIKLFEGTNRINLIYGQMTVCCGSPNRLEVGLRGSSNQDFQNRSVLYPNETWATSSLGTLNNTKCDLAYYILPAVGTTYQWTLPALDMGVSAIPDPVGCYGINQKVSVLVSNLGSQSIDFAVNPASVSMNTTGPNPRSFSKNLAGTLGTGTSMVVQMDSNYDMSASGVYDFYAAVNLTGDQFLPNNNLVVTRDVQIFPPAPLPVVNAFSTYDGSNLSTDYPGWSEASGLTPTGTTSNWDESTTSQQTFYGGNGVTARVSFFGTNTRHDWLISSKVTPTIYTVVDFKVGLTSYFGTAAAVMGSDDQVVLKASTDCGVNWTTLLTIDASNSISQALQSKSISLAAYAGQNVNLAFFASEGSIADAVFYDFHLDDITIKNVFPIDAGVVELIDPVNGGCANCVHSVSISVENFGSADLFNIPITLLISGPQTITLIDTLPILLTGAKANLIFDSSFFPTGVGPYTFKAFTSQISDAVASNDTVMRTRTFTDNPVPEIKDTVVCVSGPVTLSVPALGTVSWFNTGTGGTPLFTGNSFTTPPVATTATYFVERTKPYGATLETEFSGDRQAWGNMFDLTALNTITIDSLDIHLNTTSSETVEMYYKSGSYKGSENNAAAWTLLGTVTVTGNDLGNATRALIGGLTIPAGDTVGIYITTTVAGVMRYSAVNLPDQQLIDPNVKLTFGIGNTYPFKDIFQPRKWNGRIFYTASCLSPRVPVKITVNNLTASLNGNKVICEGQQATLNVNFSGTPPWSISYSDGLISTVVNGITQTPYLITVAPTTTTTYSLQSVTSANCTGTTSGTALVTVNPTPALSVSPATAVICKGESIALIASGAGSYLWSPSASLNNNNNANVVATPIGTTNFQLIGTGMGGCTATLNYQVVVKPVPDATFLLPFEVCENNTVAVNYLGTSTGTFTWSFDNGLVQSGTGAGPYEIRWPSPGTYTVALSIVENGCVSSPSSKTITINPNPSIPAVTQSGLGCVGQTITLSVASTDVVEWNDINNTVGNELQLTDGGSFQATITNSFGCVGQTTVETVTFNAIPSKPVISNDSPQPLCEGDNAILQSSYPTGNLWSDNSSATSLTLTSGGTFTVTYTDNNGCSSTADSITVNFSQRPSVPSVSQSGNSLTSNSTGNTYQWFSESGEITGATSQGYDPSSDGNYRVVVYSLDGCASDTSASYTYSTVGIRVNTASRIQIYPNPFATDFTIDLRQQVEPVEMRVYNALGSLVMSRDFTPGIYQISTEIPAGVYHIQLSSGEVIFETSIVKL